MIRRIFKGDDERLHNGREYGLTTNEANGKYYVSVHASSHERIYLKYASRRDFEREWKAV